MDDTGEALDVPARDLETRIEPPTGPEEFIDPYATVAPAFTGPIENQSAASDRFKIMRPLARGGLGEVFVALDGDLGREVALKEIQGRHASDPASRARFLLEAEVTGRLEHPGIVPIYGMGYYPDGRPYYAMRLIRGETLQMAIDRFHEEGVRGRDFGERIMALRRLLTRFIEICRTIDYAHSQGVLHRDLKPANVMLGPHGEVLVVDWGLAKVMGTVDSSQSSETPDDSASSVGGSITRAGSSIGTPAYMSPEQVEGLSARLGPATDIYSLGAMLYHLLTGRPAFKDMTLKQIFDRLKRGDFPPPRQVNRKISKPIEAICLKAMALQPEARYPTAAALADDLERWMAGEPISARREMFPQRLWRWAKRRPVTAAFLAIVVPWDLALSAVVGLMTLSRLTGRDMSPYLLVIGPVLAIVVEVPLIALMFSQLPMAIGAGLGALIGIFRGETRKFSRKGAVLGLKIGIVLGIVVGLYIASTHYRGTIDQYTSH